MQLDRRTILISIVAVLVVGTGIGAATGTLGAVPVVGPLVNGGCGSGGTPIAAVNDGGLNGETIVIRGEIDYSLRVEDPGMTAFELDGATGTAPVYLEEHPREELAFGDCLRVRGVVTGGQAYEGVDGPVVANATVLDA